ncbi:MAG: hypothetical protein HPPSJP_4060 [Candidatus Hepatoplasma scabrum]|nr:MAG: hypothetical protein HPPSJP_4060 [Candidatus Hepatoplasma sp.]
MDNLKKIKKDQHFKRWLQKNDKFYQQSFITNVINFIYKEKFSKYFFEYYLFALETKSSTKENFADLISKEILMIDTANKVNFIAKLFKYYYKDYDYINNLNSFLQIYFTCKNAQKFTLDDQSQLLSFYLDLKDSLLKKRVRNFNYLLILINKSFYNNKVAKFI